MPGPILEISVVLAALNEATTIGDVVGRARAAVSTSGEVIVVDDGSTDDTSSRAAAAGARVFTHSRNRGKGAAQRRGVAEARGKVLVLLDADGQDDPAEIPRLLDALTDCDLVVGSRFLGTLEPNAITRLNAAGNRALTKLINVLYRSSLTDTQAGYRAIRKSTYERCSPSATGFDVESDLLLAALAAGLRVREVPVSRAPRRTGTSRLSTVQDGFRILRRILRRRFRSPGPTPT